MVAGNVPDVVGKSPPSERHRSALAMSADDGERWQVLRLRGWLASILVRREAFVSDHLRPGDIWAKHWPLETGELPTDLQAIDAGYLLVLGTQRFNHHHRLSNAMVVIVSMELC